MTEMFGSKPACMQSSTHARARNDMALLCAYTVHNTVYVVRVHYELAVW